MFDSGLQIVSKKSDLSTVLINNPSNVLTDRKRESIVESNKNKLSIK